MLAMILDPGFKNKMLGCCLEDPDIVCEHILDLDPQIHSSVSYKKQKGEKESERSYYSKCEVCHYMDL